MTQWSEIVTAAIARSLLNDAGVTPLASDPSELLGVGGRLMRKVYQAAALQPPKGWQEGQFFVTTTMVTIGTPNTTLVALPSSPEVGQIIQIVDNAGAYVSAISLTDLRQDLGDCPPAVVVQNKRIRSAARTGDPAAGAILTVDYSYIPPVPTALTDYVGATTLTDSSTTAWPESIGNQWLIDSMALYLRVKDGTGGGEELQASIQEHGSMLGDLIGANLAKFAQVNE